jgi:hypothetical protein
LGDLCLRLGLAVVDGEVHLPRVADGRHQFVVQAGRSGPNEKVRGHVLLKRLDEHLVLASLNLESLGRADSNGGYWLRYFDYGQMVHSSLYPHHALA